MRKDIDSEIARLCEAVQTLRSRRNTLAPVSKLPNEMFIAVFSMVLLETKDSWDIVPITHVCRHWRHIALNFAILWTHIHIPPCAKMELEMLRRSRDAPMSLEIHLMKSNTAEVASRILLDTAARLWEMDVNFGFDDVPHLHEVLDTPQPLLQTARLNYVRCDFSSAVQFPGLFILSPLLHELCLDGIATDSLSSLTQLVHLEIRKYPGDELDPLELLANMRHIETFVFDLGRRVFHDPKNLSSGSHHRVKVPALRKLGLMGLPHSCLYTMDRIDFPSSTYISLETHANPDHSHSLDLVQAIGDYIRQPSRNLLVKFGVCGIRFVGSSFEWKVEEIMGEGLLPALLGAAFKMFARSLKFECLEMQSDHFMVPDWSQLLPELGHLVCLDVIIDPAACEMFNVLRCDVALATTSVIALDKLQKIIVKVTERSNHPDSGTRQEMDQNRFQDLTGFLRARKASGRPITQLDILFQDEPEEESEEYMSQDESGEVVLGSEELDSLLEMEKEFSASISWRPW